MENKKHWLMLAGLLCLKVCSLTESKCHCVTNCRGTSSAKCEECEEGWDGLFCQRRNVALKAPAMQQGFYTGTKSERIGNKTVNFTANLAVDGIFHTADRDNFFSKPLTCAHTDKRANSWWNVTINSNGINQIRYMRIYNRQANASSTRNRRNGMEILVNGQQCYKWESVTPPDISNVTCSETLTGDVVTIKVPADSLSLCEVQVFEECDHRCRCHNRSEVCDKVTGICASGCRAGFKEKTCQQECDNGAYGRNCSGKCKHCLDNHACNKVNGSCSGDCQAGWTTDTCNTECVNGTYGRNCSGKCEHCLDNHACNKVNGSCSGCCQAGWKSDTCNTECDNGTYGLKCEFACGYCHNNETCNKTNGDCPGSCEAGWTMDRCDTECPNGTHGMDCLKICGRCKDAAACNKTDGHCHTGCADGWITNRCGTAECQDRSNGEKCNSACGRCRDDQPCDTNTGLCPDGCHVDYRPMLCTKRISSSSQTGWSSVVIVLVIIGVIVAAIVVITLLVRRRKEARSSSAGSPAPFPQNASLDAEPATDVGEEAVEEEADYTVEVYVDDTYENATSCRKYSPSHILVDKLQQYIEEMRGNKGFKTEYKMHPYGINGLVEVGKLRENKKRNRFAALYPYDHSRIILQDGGESDYINASYIPGLKDSNHYIATQGPTVATVDDFWRMVWQEKVAKIVMVTNLSEMNKKKCEQYWPLENESKDCGDIHIRTEDFVSRANFNTSALVVRHKQSGQQRRVTHFHYTAWPDHDVPAAPALVSFWKKVRQADEEEARPLVVHCSAGVGRTGTFIALDYLMDQAQAENKISVYQCVAKQREARMNMIQTVNQYEFVHVAVLEGLKSKWTLYTTAGFEKTFGCCHGYSRQQEDLIKTEFKALQSLKPQLTGKAVSDALLPENITKNKNRNIVPGNKSRLFLSTPVIGCTNYINAVMLPCFQMRAKLVATQTPMQHTVVDFWRLVYDHDCFTVVCLDDDTAGLYPCMGQPLHSGPFVIEQLEMTKLDCFTERKLMLRNNKQSNSSRSLTLYSFNPPTSTMSRDTATLLELVSKVDRIVSTEDHKVLVHCPDGVELCGVFSSVLGIVSRLRLDADIDIFLTIRELQLVRPQFIQTVAQYKFCYDMVKEYIRFSNVYANM